MQYITSLITFYFYLPGAGIQAGNWFSNAKFNELASYETQQHNHYSLMLDAIYKQQNFLEQKMSLPANILSFNKPSK